MTFFLVAVVVLLAILVGVLVPTILQLRTTLASAQKFIDTTGPQVDRSLAEVTTAAQRIQHVSAELEDGVEQAKQILGSAREVVGQVGKVSRSIHTVTAIGGALGPALVAAARALFSRSQPAEAGAATRSPATDEPVLAEETVDSQGRER